MKFRFGKISLVFLTLVFICINTQTFAQTDSEVKTMFTEAQEQYADSNYTKTIEICTQILAVNPELVGVQMLISYVYDDLKKPELELQHLNEAQKLNNHPYIKWRLGEVYYKLGNYSEALYYYNQYKNYKYISEKIRLTLACKRASCVFDIQSLKQFAANNQVFVDADYYWATLSADGRKLNFIQQNNNFNEAKSEDNFVSNSDSLNGNISEQPEKSEFVNDNEIDTLSSNPEIIFFTGYNREDGFGDADIYFSRFVDGKWTTPTNAGSGLNSEKSEYQPNFDTDTKQLFFTSNRSGGAGENDIWSVKLKEFADDGSPIWTTPENLNTVNTPRNEISPFFHSETGQLYFASDGNFGMGGYDLYEVGIDKFGGVGGTVNLGYPINTKADELGLIVTNISDTAFFSSARKKGEGLEIFSFNLTRGLRTGPNFYVHVKVINQTTELPVKTNLEIVDNNRNADNTLESIDENGERMLCLKANHNYTFNISEKGFMFYSKSVSLDKTNSISNPLNFNIELEPIVIGSEIDLYNIYYETNSFAILPNSESELNRLVLFLNNNNKLKVEIQGHTDSSGNAENNMQLSKSRANSVVDYLVGKGINRARLIHNGYGDTRPVASNETEEGMRLNRRTTVKIVEK